MKTAKILTVLILLGCLNSGLCPYTYAPTILNQYRWYRQYRMIPRVYAPPGSSVLLYSPYWTGSTVMHEIENNQQVPNLKPMY